MSTERCALCRSGELRPTRLRITLISDRQSFSVDDDAHGLVLRAARALPGRTPPGDHHPPRSTQGKCHTRRVRAASDSRNTGSDRVGVAAPCCCLSPAPVISAK
jgi:hypothetical protein